MTPWSSYHLLSAAVDELPADPARLLAWMVAGVVDGLVDHGAYLAKVAGASDQALVAARLERRLAGLVALDANPVADLIQSAPDSATFASRWNGFSHYAPLGVSTELAAGQAMRRLPRTRERDCTARHQLMALCVDRIRPRADSGPVRRDQLPRLYLHAQTLALERLAPVEAIGLLYDRPELTLTECAVALGCSPRTLQRAFAAVTLSFETTRQAVRLSLAGYRIRARRETLTETAQRAGFFDSAHLVRAWRRACGLTPSQYRRLVGG